MVSVLVTVLVLAMVIMALVMIRCADQHIVAFSFICALKRKR